MNDHVVNAGLVVVSVLLVLAGLETALAVGVVEPHPDANWDVDEQRQLCERPSVDRPSDDWGYHPEYGWTAGPGVLFYQKWTPAQEWERHEINDEGFRDTYDSGDQGVVVLGDSFTYGMLASNDETYPHLLDRWNPDVSVHNYGISGYGPQQYYLVYEDRAGEVDHDLVVVGYYLGNDAKDSVVRDRPARPMFDLSDGELRQVHEPEPGGSSGDSGTWSTDRGVSVTMALFDRIDDIAAENDAEVLVVTIPSKRGGGTSPVAMKAKEHVERYAANESNVHTLNTKPALEEAREDRRVYGVYDGHPDDYGYYVIARTIQSWLVEHDDETTVDVTADPGDPTDGGLLSGVAERLRSHTASYGFLSRRTGLLVHRGKHRLGLDAPGANTCG